MISTILNSTAYKFFPLSLPVLTDLQNTLKQTAQRLGIKGTILLSPEGINLSLAALPTAMDHFKAHLAQQLPMLATLSYQETTSSFQPFQKLYIKIKKQIIPFPDEQSPLKTGTAPTIEPVVLSAWLREKRDILLLDARNHYEVAAGSFQNALQLSLKHFRDWPLAVQNLLPSLKEKIVITFCTGGIRCEKASVTLMQAGFKAVYQLAGGILNYFKQCGAAYYQGGCFVFDERGVIYPLNHAKKDEFLGSE
jgi:UPF0176 protein